MALAASPAAASGKRRKEDERKRGMEKAGKRGR